MWNSGAAWLSVERPFFSNRGMNQTPFRDFETTMQTSTPLSRYEQALSQGEFRPDDVQREAITRLDALQQALVARQQSAAPATSGLLGRLSKLIGKEKTRRHNRYVDSICGAVSVAVRPGSWISFSVYSWRSQTASALPPLYAAGA